MKKELLFIPSPGAGHLPPAVELAKLLLNRDERLSITIIIMKFRSETTHNAETPASNPRLSFIDIPSEESTMALISPTTFLGPFIEYHKPHVREIVRGFTESDSVQLAGIVFDMFCFAMADVANEFRIPSYLCFTSSASLLGLMFHLQARRDEDGFDVTELKDSEEELCVPSSANPVPAKVLPSVVFDKNGGATMFVDLAKRYRQSKGILVNTFEELETHGIKWLLSAQPDVPPVFPVGPVLNLKHIPTNDSKSDEIMKWLDRQPESSVVFLCFGSTGRLGEKQVKEMAVAIERSGHRFLWSLRCPAPEGEMGPPAEYENPAEVLPEGFLERTSSVGKVIGWAPQTAVLSHPSVGGFVSHCGWNSTLESIWFGVPIAALPLYAEQQLNAFELVVELGIASEIKIDFRHDRLGGANMFVTADDIQRGIKRLMRDGEMRKKVKEMKEKSRLTVAEGGSSYTAIRRFIDHVIM